ncbi:MAG TPA: hypothetical protein PKK43_10560, partial [Spirochaetota bacterium]|nr:hypothetical protein [Spirochaetota bacterium]
IMYSVIVGGLKSGQGLQKTQRMKTKTKAIAPLRFLKKARYDNRITVVRMAHKTINSLSCTRGNFFDDPPEDCNGHLPLSRFMREESGYITA